jgi:hypothetical protein
MICHYENKTNKRIWKYENLLYFNHCKPPTCFSHLLLPSSGRCFYEVCITKATQPMHKYKILSSEYMIHNLWYNVKKQIKLLCWIYMSKKCLWLVHVISLSWNTKICLWEVCNTLINVYSTDARENGCQYVMYQAPNLVCNIMTTVTWYITYWQPLSQTCYNM